MSVPPKRLASLSTRPGVYLFRDRRGQVLYVGKAKSLRTRVRSYFQREADLSPKNRKLMRLVSDVETIVVPYGGGGLSCGIAAAIRGQGSDATVFASEVDTAAPLTASLSAGQAVSVERYPLPDG